MSQEKIEKITIKDPDSGATLYGDITVVLKPDSKVEVQFSKAFGLMHDNMPAIMESIEGIDEVLEAHGISWERNSRENGNIYTLHDICFEDPLTGYQGVNEDATAFAYNKIVNLVKQLRIWTAQGTTISQALINILPDAAPHEHKWENKPATASTKNIISWLNVRKELEQILKGAKLPGLQLPKNEQTPDADTTDYQKLDLISGKITKAAIEIIKKTPRSHRKEDEDAARQQLSERIYEITHPVLRDMPHIAGDILDSLNHTTYNNMSRLLHDDQKYR
jgi:hypothetical protein